MLEGKRKPPNMAANTNHTTLLKKQETDGEGEDDE